MSPRLNTLTHALRDHCAAHVFQEKILLAPSRRVGFQWLDAVALSGRPIFNVRADTFRHLALQLAGPELERRGLRLVTGLRLDVLVDRIVGELIDEVGDATQGAYLAGLIASPGLTRTVSGAIRELRLAGIDSAGMSTDGFEVERKGTEVRELLAAFERALQEKNLADYPMVLRMAVERLRGEPGALTDAALLLPADLAEDLKGLELALWEALPETDRIVVPADAPGRAPEGEEVTDSMLLRWASEPAAAPAPSGDGTARFASAIGEANEVREVLRRCMEGGIPLDTVEVACTDVEVYVPHFYELAVRLLPEGAEDLPVTFADGIPTRYSRPGRALIAWLAWARDGYPQQALVRMLRDGLLEIPGARELGLSFARFGAIMRTVPVGSGLERYVPQLEKAVGALRARLDEASSPGPAAFDEDEEDARRTSAAELEHLRARSRGLEALLSLMRDIAGNAPASSADPRVLLEQTRYFLTGLSRSASKVDAYAKERLLETLDELAACLEEYGAGSFDVAGWLADLPVSVRVGGQGPRPGCLHVSGIAQGGHSGRPHTFVIGMDDTRFPGVGLQDALLLDSERGSISPELPTAVRRVEARVRAFARLCARLRGDVTLSFCCRSLADDREMFPSRVLVAACRAATGQPVTTVALEGPPASFAPAVEDACLDMTEWWLWRMCAGGAVRDPEEVVGRSFANLEAGFRAIRARLSDEFTEYDGYVPEAGADNDCASPGGPVISPSRLGTLAACPMEYFFKYILKVEPPEEFEIDPARWLDPLEQGTLLHAVFCDFIRALQDRGDLPPDFERDRADLHEILDGYIERMKIEKPPPPDPDVFTLEQRALAATADSFLQMESEFCRRHEPVACELAVGVPPEGDGTAYDLAEAVEVLMPNGRTVRVRCKLDRVDRVLAGKGDEYIVCDYKTGKSDKYRRHGPFHDGRFMQAAIYPVAAEAALRELHGEGVITSFEYVFPGPGEFKRMRWDVAGLGEGMVILELLCEMITSGCFAFTTDKSDTNYSDYKAAFGDRDEAVVGIARKLANPANEMLDPYRALRAVVEADLEELS